MPPRRLYVPAGRPPGWLRAIEAREARRPTTSRSSAPAWSKKCASLFGHQPPAEVIRRLAVLDAQSRRTNRRTAIRADRPPRRAEPQLETARVSLGEALGRRWRRISTADIRTNGRVALFIQAGEGRLDPPRAASGPGAAPQLRSIARTTPQNRRRARSVLAPQHQPRRATEKPGRRPENRLDPVALDLDDGDRAPGDRLVDRRPLDARLMRRGRVLEREARPHRPETTAVVRVAHAPGFAEDAPGAASAPRTCSFGCERLSSSPSTFSEVIGSLTHPVTPVRRYVASASCERIGH
jgi:hypothetical protein